MQHLVRHIWKAVKDTCVVNDIEAIENCEKSEQVLLSTPWLSSSQLISWMGSHSPSWCSVAVRALVW